MRKHVFHIHNNIVTKKWGGIARKNFSRKTRIVPEKMLGTKSIQKRAKSRFLYSHKNRHQKMGKYARNNFSRNTRIMQSKNVGKKLSQKSAKTRFLYSHEYRDQKMG